MVGMIYIGHFSFKCPDRGREADGCHGYFTVIVEAESVDRAENKFQHLLRRLHKTSTVFDELKSVYLDSCIEIRSMPKNGFVAYFNEIRGESLGEISTELIGVGDNSKHVSAYHVVEHPEKEDAESSVLEPFLILDK
jgi:hypothetical protein